MLHDLVVANRSYRRFIQNKPVEESVLRELVDLGRLSASAANLQSLKYVICNDPQKNAMIFPCLAWAGYLQNWGGPKEGERPAAYITILLDKDISKNPFCDHGISAQSILLGAVEKGLGGCMIGSVDKEKLARVLGLGERYEILLVLALGYPAEKIVLEEISADGSIKYYRDVQDVHHVPKRRLDDVILKG